MIEKKNHDDTKDKVKIKSGMDSLILDLESKLEDFIGLDRETKKSWKAKDKSILQ